MGLRAISKYNRGSNGKSPIEEIILLVQLGDERDKDRPPAVHYITLTCNFTFSCFGMPRKGNHYLSSAGKFVFSFMSERIAHSLLITDIRSY